MSETPEHGSRKINITKARRIVGMTARNYSDEEMEQIIELHYQIAELAYRQFVDSEHSDL